MLGVLSRPWKGVGLDARVTSDPISAIVKTLPWDLADLIAYLLLGVMTGLAGLAAFYGFDRVTAVVEQHVMLVGAAAIMFGYPIGVLTMCVGRLVREVLPGRVGLGGDPDLKSDTYANYVATSVNAVIGKRLVQQGAPQLSATVQVRVGVLLAGKYLPGVVAALDRQESMFRFFVTLVGGGLFGTLVFEAGAVLRWLGALPGSPVPYAAWGLVPLCILVLAEYGARSANAVVAEVMADTAAAVSVLLASEEHKKS